MHWTINSWPAVGGSILGNTMAQLDSQRHSSQLTSDTDGFTGCLTDESKFNNTPCILREMVASGGSVNNENQK